MNRDLEKAIAWTVDRIAVQDVISAVPFHTDLKEYNAVYQYYTDDAVMDYQSMHGEGNVLLPVREQRQRFMESLPGLDATQHQISNFQIVIDGDEARSRAHVRATHRLDQDLWILGGVYHHRLRRTPEGWKICYHRFQKLYEEGPDLLPRAVERARIWKAAAQ